MMQSVSLGHHFQATTGHTMCPPVAVWWLPGKLCQCYGKLKVKPVHSKTIMKIAPHVVPSSKILGTPQKQCEFCFGVVSIEVVGMQHWLITNKFSLLWSTLFRDLGCCFCLASVRYKLYAKTFLLSEILYLSHTTVANGVLLSKEKEQCMKRI